MATWAVGDVQGCDGSLGALLDTLDFSPDRDRLWLVGDLVNRGPASAAVLRRVRALGDRARVVLGNHDLHLLAAAAGLRKVRSGDTFGDVLEAPDRDELLAWLAARPLAWRETVGGRAVLMVHAGLHPDWTVEQALALAAEGERALAEGRLLEALAKAGHPPWRDELSGGERLRSLIGYLTRLRACTPAGRALERFVGPPEELPEGALPWWAVPGRASSGTLIVCGHWAAQGLRREPDMLALDSGCVWGQQLTAVDLESDRVVSVPCADPLG